MQTSSFKKEVLNFLGLFVLIFVAVFAAISIIDLYKNFQNLETFLVSGGTKSPNCVFGDEPNSIFIPKIEVKAPLVFVDEKEGIDYIDALNNGVVHYPGSSLPNQKGISIFLGHSAPPGWPKIRYDWVFSRLNDLEQGDKIYIFYNQCKFEYTVEQKAVVKKGEELPSDLTDSENSALVLVSCWPPGKNLWRLAVKAESSF